MKKFNKIFLIIYVCFYIITLFCFIFWWDKEEFDLEYGEKGTTTAIIFNFETDQVIQELYDGRRTEVHNVEYFEYSYVVGGVKYEYGSPYYGNSYSIGDRIEIEYVKRNPAKSKIPGLNTYRFNYFIRNSLNVGILAFVLMLFFIGFLDFFKDSETVNKLLIKIEKLITKGVKPEEINLKKDPENVTLEEIEEFLNDKYFNLKSDSTTKE